MTGDQSESASQRPGNEPPPPTPQPVPGAHPAGGIARSKEFREILAALEPPPAGAQVEVRSSAWRSRLLIIIAALGLVVLGLAQSPLLRLHPRDVPVPEEFLGSWATTSPRYLDRGFLITRDSLWLRLGPGESTAYPILGVRSSGPAVLKSYLFRYRDSSSTLELALRMHQDTTIHIANLPSVLWKKESE
jgi:hypothetical protein